jgi:hypothetical protein
MAFNCVRDIEESHLIIAYDVVSPQMGPPIRHCVLLVASRAIKESERPVIAYLALGCVYASGCDPCEWTSVMGNLVVGLLVGSSSSSGFQHIYHSRESFLRTYVELPMPLQLAPMLFTTSVSVPAEAFIASILN